MNLSAAWQRRAQSSFPAASSRPQPAGHWRSQTPSGRPTSWVRRISMWSRHTTSSSRTSLRQQSNAGHAVLFALSSP